MTKKEILYKKIDDIVDAHYLENTNCADMARQIISLVQTYDRESIVKVYEGWKSDYRKHEKVFDVIVRAGERERILADIASTEYFTQKDMKYLHNIIFPESEESGCILK